MSGDSMVVVFDGDAVVTEKIVQNALSKQNEFSLQRSYYNTKALRLLNILLTFPTFNLIHSSATSLAICFFIPNNFQIFKPTLFQIKVVGE